MIAARSGARAAAMASFAVSLALCLTGVAAAQRGGRGGGGGDVGGGAPAYQFTRLQLLEQDFKLTKDQKKSVKALLDDAHKSAAPIRDALASTRTQIVAVIQRNGSEAEIDAAVKAYANQAAAMTALEMNAFADLLKAITPEQRGDPNAMRAAFFLMRGIFIDKKWDEVPEGKGY